MADSRLTPMQLDTEVFGDIVKLVDTQTRMGTLIRKFERVDREKIQELLQIQKQLAEEGKVKKIGELAVQKGILKKRKMTTLLKKQKELLNTLYKIHGYEIEELIARGGMGAVYKARQKSTGRIVAIKILPSELSKNSTYLSKFRSEMRIIMNLRHPNLVAAIDSGDINGLIYYVMEFVDGLNCYQILQQRGPFSESELLEICFAVTKVLCYLQDYGIIHRDIKPQNILITNNNKDIKLCDLGTVKEMVGSANKAFDSIEDNTVSTPPGDIIGTPLYMSPEQVKAMELDQRSDLYSLGVTLHHLSVGRPPLTGQPTEIIRAHVFGDIQPPKVANPSISDRINALISKLIQPDITKRFQSPHELLLVLEKLMSGRHKFSGKRRVNRGPVMQRYHQHVKSSGDDKLMKVTCVALTVIVLLLVFYIVFTK